MLKKTAAVIIVVFLFLGCSNVGNSIDNSVPDVANLNAYYGNGRVKLNWKEPIDSTYKGVEISTNGSVVGAVSKGINRKAITGLTNGVEYVFTVVAIYTDKRSSGVTIAATPNGSAGSNLVENGYFNDGLRSWRLDIGRDWGANQLGNGELTAASGVMHVRTTEIGTDLDASRLQAVQKYPGFTLVNGKVYKVQFDAWANSPRKLSVSVWENGRDLDGNGSKWTPYGGIYTCDLTTAAQTFTYNITMTSDNDDAGIGFFCGSSLGDTYIDNVVITQQI